MKKIRYVKKTGESHWVGNGFPVHSIFSYRDNPDELSPFLLLDYAGPAHFPATEQKLGVGEHPHRGFETVTIVYEGEVEHRDSSGAGGIIRPGDVQWMTAGSGLVHEEFHSRDYAQRGGPFEMIQLWVNLPKKNKSAPPGYQAIRASQIPTLDLPEKAGSIRVIAGEYEAHQGPAHTYSPVNLWDIELKAKHRVQLKLPEGYHTSLFVMKGGVMTPEGETIQKAELGVWEQAGKVCSLEAFEDTKLLLLNGKPLNEPVVGYGPFVMNTMGEIKQAFEDYYSGRMGHLH